MKSVSISTFAVAIALTIGMTACGNTPQPTAGGSDDSATATTENNDQAASSEKPSDEEILVGTWQYETESDVDRFAFDGDSIIAVSGSLPAKVSPDDGTLTISAPGGSAEMEYSLPSSDELIITTDGSSKTYTRVSDSPDDLIEHVKVKLGDSIDTDEWSFTINNYEWIDGGFELASADIREDEPDKSYLVLWSTFTNKYTEELYLDSMTKASFVLGDKYNVSASVDAEPGDVSSGPVQPLATEKMVIYGSFEQSQIDAAKDGLVLNIAVPIRLGTMLNNGSYTIGWQDYVPYTVYEIDLS